MDREDVLRLAREAGIPSVLLSEVGLMPADDAVSRFAALVMEECAGICGKWFDDFPYDECALDLANAIRAAKPKG